MKKTAILIIIGLMLFSYGCAGAGDPEALGNAPGASETPAAVSPPAPSASQTPEDKVSPVASASAKPASPWSRGKDMPTARYALRSAVLDGILYVFGGENGQFLKTVETYDPIADSWAQKSDLPIATGCIGAAAADGKIYVFMQGETYDKNGLVYAYDPLNDSWTLKAEMTSNRCNLAITEYEGKIYVIGGLSNTDAEGYFKNVSTVEAFDPAAGTWEKKADMPTPRHALSVSVYDGKLFAVAGSWTKGDYDVPCRIVEAYDPETDTWESKSKLPYETAYHCTVTVGDRIYLAGGVRPGHMFSYDPASDVWSYSRDREIASWQNCMAEIGGKIYMAGGTLGPNDDWVPMTSLEIFNPALE